MLNSPRALYHLLTEPWTTWVGYRYLKSKKTSRFLSFITVLSMGGVGLGVTAMIVVLSVMDGFEQQLKKRLMGADIHVMISPTPQTFSFDRGYVDRVVFDDSPMMKVFGDSPHVTGAWPVVKAEAILRLGRKVTGIELKGVEKERFAQLKDQIVEEAEERLLREDLGGRSIQLPGLSIGMELAHMMGLIPGDRVTIISPTDTQGPLESIPRMKKFVVESIYRSGLAEQELHTVFAESKAVRSFLRKRDVVSHWEVTVDEFERAPLVASQLRKVAGTFKVRDWVQLNSNLFASLQLERIAMFVIMAVIIIVASFNIVTTLTLMVIEKKKEISILKAMGAQHSQVGAIFLAEGLLIGVLGVLGGLLSAGVICSALKRYEFIQLPDIYYDRTLPVTFDLRVYFIVAICSFLIVLIACLYPSLRASKLNPLDGIRVG